MNINVMDYIWTWYWRKDPEAELPEGGILCQPRTGQAYSVVRMPRYMDQEEWEVLAPYICGLHNSVLLGGFTDDKDNRYPGCS